MTINNFWTFSFAAETIFRYCYSANGKRQRQCRSVHDEASGCRWRLRAYWSDRPLLCNRVRDARWSCPPVPLFARGQKNSGQEIQYGKIMLFIRKKLMITLCMANRVQGKMLNSPFFKAGSLRCLEDSPKYMYNHRRKSMLRTPKAQRQNGSDLALFFWSRMRAVKH